MALLDAASIAEGLHSQSPILTSLSEAGRFESMPGGAARFCETRQMRAAVQRPISGHPMTGQEILALLVDTASNR